MSHTVTYHPPNGTSPKLLERNPYQQFQFLHTPARDALAVEVASLFDRLRMRLFNAVEALQGRPEIVLPENEEERVIYLNYLSELIQEWAQCLHIPLDLAFLLGEAKLVPIYTPAFGGSAAVYEVIDLMRADGLLVLKIPHPLRPQMTTILERENQHLMKLEHPHIIAVDTHPGLNGETALLMPWAGYRLDAMGGDVFPLLGDGDGAPGILDIIDQLLDALEYLHREQLVHGDVKPANVLLHHGHVTLIDFGLCRNSSSFDRPPLGDRKAVDGTPTSIPPEMWLRTVTPFPDRIDLYGVGVILFYLLTGNYPYRQRFPGARGAEHFKMRVIQDPIPVHYLKELRVPKRVICFLKKLLRKKPRTRITATNAREELSKIREVLMARGENWFPEGYDEDDEDGDDYDLDPDVLSLSTQLNNVGMPRSPDL